MTILLINNNLYEINETNVDVYDISTGECTATQQTLNQIFNLPIETIDAAINWGNDTVYFFKEDKYYKYDIANNECAADYPLPIADNWKGIADNVWACVRRQDKAYFFNEKQYTRYDCEGDTADENYPLIISENWKDIPETITGIVMLNDATALMQNNSDYYLYDWENDAVLNNNGNQLLNTLQQFVSNGSSTPTVTNLDWFTVLSNKSNYSSTEINTAISTITTNRTAIKTYVKTTPGGYVYYGSASSKPTSIVANTVEDWVWDEIKGEGNFASMNAYDNMIVTWGKGIAGTNITGVLKNIFAKSTAIKNEFFNVGINMDAALGLCVVDTKTATIISGANTFATIKADTKLLDFFVDIALNNSYKDIIANAQWDFVLGVNASLITHVKTNSWGKDAVQLLVHLNYWLPGYAWVGHKADYIATAGDCTKIILAFKKNQLQFGGELVKHLKAFGGNAFAKYIALPKYQTPLAANTCAIFEDGANKYYVPL